MDEKKQSILKQKAPRAPLQERFVPDFTEDETVTTTINRSRRVSFVGTNYIKEFEKGSNVTRFVSEYEQAFSSSESSLQMSVERSVEDIISPPETFNDEKKKATEATPLNVSVSYQCGGPKPRISTIVFNADSPTADMEFAKGCLSLAKSIYQRKDQEMELIIKPKCSEEVSSAEPHDMELTECFRGPRGVAPVGRENIPPDGDPDASAMSLLDDSDSEEPFPMPWRGAADAEAAPRHSAAITRTTLLDMSVDDSEPDMSAPPRKLDLSTTYPEDSMDQTALEDQVNHTGQNKSVDAVRASEQTNWNLAPMEETHLDDTEMNESMDVSFKKASESMECSMTEQGTPVKREETPRKADHFETMSPAQIRAQILSHSRSNRSPLQKSLLGRGNRSLLSSSFDANSAPEPSSPVGNKSLTQEPIQSQSQIALHDKAGSGNLNVSKCGESLELKGKSSLGGQEHAVPTTPPAVVEAKVDDSDSSRLSSCMPRSSEDVTDTSLVDGTASVSGVVEPSEGDVSSGEGGNQTQPIDYSIARNKCPDGHVQRLSKMFEKTAGTPAKGSPTVECRKTPGTDQRVNSATYVMSAKNSTYTLENHTYLVPTEAEEPATEGTFTVQQLQPAVEEEDEDVVGLEDSLVAAGEGHDTPEESFSLTMHGRSMVSFGKRQSWTRSPCIGTTASKKSRLSSELYNSGDELPSNSELSFYSSPSELSQSVDDSRTDLSPVANHSGLMSDSLECPALKGVLTPVATVTGNFNMLLSPVRQTTDVVAEDAARSDPKPNEEADVPLGEPTSCDPVVETVLLQHDTSPSPVHIHDVGEEADVETSTSSSPLPVEPEALTEDRPLQAEGIPQPNKETVESLLVDISTADDCDPPPKPVTVLEEDVVTEHPGEKDGEFAELVTEEEVVRDIRGESNLDMSIEMSELDDPEKAELSKEDGEMVRAESPLGLMEMDQPVSVKAELSSSRASAMDLEDLSRRFNHTLSEQNMSLRLGSKLTRSLNQSTASLLPSFTLQDEKVSELLETQSREAGCLWAIDPQQTAEEDGTCKWLFSSRVTDCPVSIVMTVKRASVFSDDPHSFVADCSLLPTPGPAHRLHEEDALARLCLHTLREAHFTDARVETTQRVPHFLDRVNATLSKLQAAVLDMRLICEQYPGSRLRDTTLTFRLSSFPLMFSCLVAVDVKDMFHLSTSCLRFHQQFGRLNEDKIRNIFDYSVKNCLGLVHFIVEANKFVVEQESVSGLVSKRSHIPLLASTVQT